MERTLTPELLDVLPSSDPLAIGSRRDLARINALMFQASIMTGQLRRHVPPPRRILDIGSGDGRFTLSIARRMVRHWPVAELVLLDRSALVPQQRIDQFAELGWRAEAVASDACAWMEQGPEPGFDLVMANLFLHHFKGEALARLLAAAGRLSPVLCATEPRRSLRALAAARLLGAIGANAITRHDAEASVAAGFAGRELTDLWPGGVEGVLVERDVGPFTHVFVTGPGP